MIIDYKLENAGVECWYACAPFYTGKCKWCGPEGYCCRQNWIGDGCDGVMGAPDRHVCTLKPEGKIFATLTQNIPDQISL